MATAKNVKDVSPHEFVKAYAAHLKRSGKVILLLDPLVCRYRFKNLVPFVNIVFLVDKKVKE